MNDWNSLDGNPAPGDPSRILHPGADECSRIADEARRAFKELERVKYEFTSSIWMGDTAIEFSRSLPTVIDDLSKLNRGYEQVAAALRDYAKQLSYLQTEALTTLRKADVAQTNIHASRVDKGKAEEFQGQSISNRDRAEANARSCEAKVEYLTKQHLNLQIQRSKATDPVQIAAIDQSITNASAQLRAAQSQHRDAVNSLLNTEVTLDEATSQVNLASSRLSDANDQYQAERQRASLIRDDHRSNAKRAAAAIRDAKGTAVGTDWERFKHKVSQTEAFQKIQETLDLVADILGPVMSFIERLSTILGNISFVVGLLSLVPGLNVALAPLAAALLMVTTVLSAIVLVKKIIEGRSSGWTLAADAFTVALGVIGLRGAASTLKGASATLNMEVGDVFKEGMKTAFLSPKGFRTHTQNAKDFITQGKENLTRIYRGTFATSAGKQLRMSVHMKTVRYRPGAGDLKGISRGDIFKAIAGGTLRGKDAAAAIFTHKGTVSASTALDHFDRVRRISKGRLFESVD